MTSTLWGAATVVLGYLLTLLLIRSVLLSKKRQPASSVAWILIIVTVPLLGGLLYLLFGINRVQRRVAGKHQAARTVHRHLPRVMQHQLVPAESLNPQQQQLMRVAHRVAGTLATDANEVELLDDTNRTLGLIEQAILSARETIHLEYYIWQADATGTRVRDLLIQRAKEGVTVRFLYDKIGSLWLSWRFLKPMVDAGISVATFLPGMTLRERWSVNLRNHRKIVIVDGVIGFTGGMNIGDEYLGRDPRTGFWRDTHLRLEGPCVLQLQQVFVEDWYYATGEELTQPEIFPEPEESGQARAQVISGGPSGEYDSFLTLMFAALTAAEERITLAMSYFVPPDALVTALETAAHRGVRVRILLSGPASYWWTVQAGRSYYESLLQAGVEIYEYQQGLMHSKTLAIDGSWALVGSANFDARSLMLNFEVGVALYDGRVAEQLEEQFERDLEVSRRIDPGEWSERPNWRVLVENACRLFAPVL